MTRDSIFQIASTGERWMYSTGAKVLGVLAARAAGQPFGEVLRTRIFEPLGMRDTGFWTADIRRPATAYQLTPDGLAVLDEPHGKWSRPPEFGDGAAGLPVVPVRVWSVYMAWTFLVSGRAGRPGAEEMTR